MSAMAVPAWGDSGQGDLLALVAMGPMAPDTADLEYSVFLDILRDAGGAGLIDQNAVRERFRGRIAPRRIGAFWSAAARSELIRAEGWSISDDDAGRNRGKPMRCYRWIGGDR